ncbi:MULTISPECIES: bile acid:sodium symporter family protein [Snodgrassella]|uniref:ketopantoate/pantoate/pantothenate transporter PanS n=1 Tax=Snodgrassella TaxID=1193515 RepID=UPI002269D53F|nr:MULTISPECIES: bile acid:sodium symporter family protein [unclassified Snodgrassella]MCX8746258.1 bile acid:sodium symporter family protein [Snodgrassella sp. B3800]MCX8747940.1 bile acid:sodium symporter family protein [Snodgrassella sp. B3088]MCX8753020.1 bile acid:sodium symporter family protein [Snodgrassella sp. B3837]
MIAIITRLFPLWAALCSIFAYLNPAVFAPLKPYISEMLMLVMLSMGMTLKIADFTRVLKRPAPIVAGIGLHYLIMPLAAWLIARLLNMSPELQAGMVLVGCVASGTASNVMVFLSKGDVALSVTISALSTVVGIFATPLLAKLYIAASIAVPVVNMLKEILLIVALPIAIGVGINYFIPQQVKKIVPSLPLITMCVIILVLATVVSLSSDKIGIETAIVVFGVILHNGLGLIGGYWGGRLFGFDKSICRTLALEVGMQNSGLAAVLGTNFFGPMAAIPGAIFSLWHNISGSFLAGYWSTKPTGTSNDKVKREDVSLH